VQRVGNASGGVLACCEEVSWEPELGQGGPETRRIESIMGGRRSSELALDEERTGKRLVSGRTEERGRREAIGGENTA
jgi:hypothetical protein